MTVEATRDRVLRVAMELFGERGYAATTISMIESAAGLSPGSGSLYRHFSSKQELLEVGEPLGPVRGQPVRLLERVHESGEERVRHVARRRPPRLPRRRRPPPLTTLHQAMARVLAGGATDR